MLQPALFLIGDKDPVGTLEAYGIKAMPRSGLEQHVIAGCGHWLQNEPREVNAHLLGFLARHYPNGN